MDAVHSEEGCVSVAWQLLARMMVSFTYTWDSSSVSE